MTSDLPNDLENPDQMQYNDMSNSRRASRYDAAGKPAMSSFSSSAIDHFDHYKRPPSRDSSVDRYARATSRMTGSRQPSVDRTVSANPAAPAPGPTDTPDRNARAGSAFRSTPPAASTTTANGAVLTGTGAARSGTPVYHIPSVQPVYSSPNQPFEDVLLRQRTLGQDIIPSPREPKRTESLYLPPVKLLPSGGGGGGGGAASGGGAKSKLKVSARKMLYLFFKTLLRLNVSKI